MPKEVLYGTQLPYSDDDPGRSVVEVRWSGEAGHIQLVTRCIRADTHETYVPDEWQEALQQLPEADQYPGILTCHDGFYVDLDRRTVNDLICKLRRARDQAFGRDE